jgi:hypothetical protein
VVVAVVKLGHLLLKEVEVEVLDSVEVEVLEVIEFKVFR